MGKKLKGNGEGTLYKNNKTGLYIGQYYANGKRHSIYQKKNEKIGDFKKRFNDILSSINNNKRRYYQCSKNTTKNRSTKCVSIIRKRGGTIVNQE